MNDTTIWSHDYLDEIDAQVRRYTRAATQKVENLTNRDQNVRGNLNALLSALSRNQRMGDLVDRIQPVFQLYEQSFLSEKSLWYRKRPGKRAKARQSLFKKHLLMRMRQHKLHNCYDLNTAGQQSLLTYKDG